MNFLDAYRKRRGKKMPFDLFDHCPPGTHCHVAEVVMRLNTAGVDFSFARDEVQRQISANRERVSAERTSEIFITGQTRGGRVEKRRLSFYFLEHGSWVSHFYVRDQTKTSASVAPLSGVEFLRLAQEMAAGK